MTPRLSLLCLLALAVLLGLVTDSHFAAWAQTASPSPAAAAGGVAVTPAEAQQALDVLQDPRKRGQLIETLRVIAKAAPGAPPTTPPGAAAGPAAPASPAAATAPAASSALALAPNSLGAQLLRQLSYWSRRVTSEAAAAVKAATALPSLWEWARELAADPASRAALLDAAWQLLLVLGAALLVEGAVRWVLRRPFAALLAHAAAITETEPAVPRENAPAAAGAEPAQTPASAISPAPAREASLLRRLPFAVARLLLDLAPVAAFAGVGDLLSGIVAEANAQLVGLTLVNAYALARAILCGGRFLLAPSQPRLRLLPLDDAAAGYLLGWLCRVTAIAVFGGALASIASLLGLDQGAYDTLVRLIGLAVAAALIALVLRVRHRVAGWLAPPTGTVAGVARWRSWLAGAWHYLACLVIAAAWIIWAAGARDGSGGLRFLFGTVAVLGLARLASILALGGIDRLLQASTGRPHRFAVLAARAGHYRAPARGVALALIDLLALVLLFQVWGLDAIGWLVRDRVGSRVSAAVITTGIAVLVAVVIWEAANAALEARLARLRDAGAADHAARLRTLLPILRATLLCAILAIVGLTALSEIGVNIAPLLAGAGIVGIAVGFGSQKLVQDVITGMFVLFENAIQVGDWVTVVGLSGNVEQLSVRNIWLRGDDGTVHVIPFSAVTSISNANRGFANAAVAVTVAYKEDSGRVEAALTGIAEEMRNDPRFAPMMLSGLKLLGVDTVKASGVTILGEITCTARGRWPVQREFNRRLQQRFQQLGIELTG